jgi:type I restriction enzyme S subunit
MCAISGKTEEELAQLSHEAQQQLKTTAALFPDTLVDSELGEIPEGWGVQKIDDVIELAYGKALKKTDRIEGEYPVYGSGGVTGTHQDYLVKAPGVIVGRKGTVGSLYWEDKSFFPIDTVFYVKCKKGMTLFFAYYLLQVLGLNEMNTDAAVPGLNRNNVYRLEVIDCRDALMKEFTSFVVDLRNKIRLNNEEIVSLVTIRDTLLPKLLSGELALDEVV